MFGDWGRVLILTGVFLVVLGIMLVAGHSIPWLGRCPGDLFVKKGNFSFYFPMTSCILVSLVLTLLLYLFRR